MKLNINQLLFLIISLKTCYINTQICQSNYFPFFNGTCIRPQDCVGAIINNKCPGNTSKCCILETNTRFANPRFVTQLELERILSRRNKRIELISNVLVGPSSNPTCFAKAFYISQLAHESNNFMDSEEVGSDSRFESLYFKKDGLGNDIPGDGAKFKGRGFIQLTGRFNYRTAGRSLGVDLENQPELAAFPTIAAQIARWYWVSKTKYNLNDFADGTFYGYSRITGLINGGLNHLKERFDILKVAMETLQCGELFKGRGESCTINGNSGFCLPLCTNELEGNKFCGCNGRTVVGLCNGPTNIRCCSERCSNDMDLTFVIDSSGSISPSDFQKIIIFMENIVNNLEIGENKTRVGIINYSNTVIPVAKLNSIFSKSILLETIRGIRRIGSLTYTGEALQEAKNFYNKENGARDSEQVLTDGVSNGRIRPEPVAASIRSLGITIISIGVGSSLNFQELIGISSEGRTFKIDSFTTVLNLFDEIKQETCLIPAQIPAKTTTLTIGKDEIKYFSYKIIDLTSKSLKIILNNILGRLNLFLSFTSQNPNGFEKIDTRIFSKRQVKNANLDRIERSILIPENVTQISEFIYLGIEGLEELNSFQIEINESMIIEKEDMDEKLCKQYLNSGIKCDSPSFINNVQFNIFCMKSCNFSLTTTEPTTASSLVHTTTKPVSQTTSEECKNQNEELCKYFMQFFDLCNLNSFIREIPFKIYCCKACKEQKT